MTINSLLPNSLWSVVKCDRLTIILAFPGFEATHLCDPSDQRRLQVEGLADWDTATQGSLAYEK